MKPYPQDFQPSTYLAAFGISGAMSGMLMCINTLLAMSRGLSLSQIALGFFLLSFFQVVFEVPSGMLGDLYGRKRVWVAAMILRLIYLPIFLFGHGIIVLLCYACNGICNALNSGTLDAMYLENWLHARGNQRLSFGTALQQAVQFGSQATGALLGGALSTISFFRPYTANLLISIALCASCLAMVAHRIPSDTGTRHGSPLSLRGLAHGFSGQITRTLRLAGTLPLVLFCLLCVLPYGFSCIGVEGYWQPRLLDLLHGQEPGMLLGMFSCAAMVGVVMGGFAADKLIRRTHTARAQAVWYLAIRITAAFLIAVMALTVHIEYFFLGYAAYYLLLGMFTCVDSVLLQAQTPDEVRGTVMSAENLMQMTGAMAGTAVCSFWLGSGSIPGLWLFLSAAMAGGTCLCLVPVWAIQRRHQRKPLQNV